MRLDSKRRGPKRYTGLRSGGGRLMVDLVQTKREQILRLARRHGVTRVRVFGSMARGDAGPDSDVDLLIEVGRSQAHGFLVGSLRSWKNSWVGACRLSRSEASMNCFATACLKRPSRCERRPKST